MERFIVFIAIMITILLFAIMLATVETMHKTREINSNLLKLLYINKNKIKKENTK